MPDQENYVNRPAVAVGLPQTPIVPQPGPYSGPGGDGVPGKDISVNNMFLGGLSKIPSLGVADIPMSAIYSGSRYTETRPFTDYEEMAAQQQGTWDKWRNSLGKMVGIAGTTFVSGTAGLVYGIGSAAINQRWADLIDNPITRSMDDISKRLDDYAPNYYTKAEQDAEWYSPDNILTANFWSDKVLKNLGFSVGALGGGVAWTSLFRNIGIVNKLVRAGQGIEAATAVENAMATVPKLQKYAAFENALSSVAQKYVKTPVAGMLKDSERILTSTMGTFGEASIEGLQNMNDFRDKAIQEYIDKFGTRPQGKDLEEINRYADKVGMYTWGFNSLLLTGTNYIQLPKILSSSRSVDKALINSVEQKAVGAKWEQLVPKTTLGKIGAGVARTTKALATGESTLLFAPSEAFEEGAQFAIQKGVNNYFKRAKDNREDVNSFISNLSGAMGNVFGEGVDETLSSKEGLESILIGGISGGIQQIRGTIKEKGILGGGGARQKNTDIAITALNKTNLEKVLKDGVNFLGIGIGSQKLRQQAIVNNDKLSEKDYEQDFVLSYVMPRAKYGKIDSVNQELSLYESQAMTDDGFNQLVRSGIANQKETREDFLARIGNLKQIAKNVDGLYTAINDKYGDQFDEQGKKIYSDDVVDKLVYAASKVTNYDERIPGVNAKLLNVGLTTQDAVDQALKEGKNDVEEVTKANAKIDELNVDDDTKIELKSTLKDLVDLALLRKKFIDEYNDVRSNPIKYKEKPVEPEAPVDENAPKEFIKLKTKRGEVSLEIGKQLYLGRVTKKATTGEDFFQFPIFTILADNGDGTIKVRQEDGTIKDIKKSDFDPYYIGSVEETAKNKKAKYFIDHRNTVFEHKGIKDANGKPVKGRLEYSPKEDVLLFRFINKWGKERTIEVKNTQFVAQKGYAKPMVEAVGQLTAAQQSSLEAYTKDKEDIRTNIERRKQTVVDLVTASKDRLDDVNDQLDKAKKSLNDVEEALKNATHTKKGLPRKNLRAYKKTIDQLAKQKEALQNTINTLNEEKEDLEIQLPYMESLLEYAETMPEDYKDAIEDLKDDINSIEEMIDNTNDAIKTGTSLLSKVDALLKDALSIVDDFVKRLQEENPNIPLFIDDFRASIERFLGEEGAKDFIAQKLGYTQTILDLQEQVSEFTEEMNIPNLSKRTEDLQENLKELEAGLDDLTNQQIAKAKLLEAFETSVAKFEQELAEEQRLQQDEAFVNMIMKTGDTSQRTIESEEPYEEDSRKSNTNIPRATVASQKIPGYERSQTFGNNLPNLPEKERQTIKAVIVTRKNQDDILPGLIEHLNSEEKLSEEEMNATIAVVMVKEQPDGSRRLIGVDGNVLENPTVDNAIYQVMPTEKLEWSEEYGVGSMFRDKTPDNVIEELKKQYAEWRKGILENPPTRTFSIEASFGVPQRVPQKDENGLVITNKKGVPLEDKTAVVSASEAGLITEDALENKRVLTIPTTNGIIDRGTTLFKNAIGRVFLTLSNGFVKLENRQLTEKEATTVYQATLRLSEIMFEEGNIKSEEAQRLLRWLKTVVYWGTPKDAQGKEKQKGGRNSVYFKSTTVEGSPFKQLRLFISNKGESVPFTASYLRDNKSQMIALFQELYNNVNSTRANGGKKNEWSEPYEEILEVKPNGEVVSREWQNYQTFLLSSKNPDGSARKNEELPLHTNIRPKTGPEDANRQGIYFVLTDLKYKEPTPKAAPKAATPTKIVPGAKTAPQPQAPEEAKEGEIDLSGKKINTFTSPSGKKIKWMYDPSKSGINAIIILKGEDLDEVFQSLTKSMGSEEKAKNNIKQFVLLSIPTGALEDSDEFVIGEDDVETFEDADTYVEPEPDEKAEEEEPFVADTEDEDIEAKMREEDDEDDELLLRQVIDEDVTETENWPEIERWLKANFPNLPVYRVKNILKGTNGLQAWGMLKNGALYVYENAEVGTLYHEVFEGVWKLMSSPKERKAVIKEFTSRKGTFVDRPTGQVIAYKDATNSQVKEQLAEEFRDYVQYGKIPAKPVDGRPFIVKLFADIVNAVKNFFANTPGAKNNTERLFAKIGTGYYKNYIPFETNLSFAKQGIIDIEDATITADSELRLKLPGETVHDIMQQMTYLTLRDIISSNDSLFNVENKPKAELYRMLRYELGRTILKKARAARKLRNNGKLSKEKAAPIIEKGIALWKTTMKNWEDIVKKHEEYLRSYSIEFDENDEMNIRADENTGRGEFDSSDKIDHFRKTNSAIKLLLSTIPIMENGDPQYSSVNGVKLLPLSQVYMALMNNLHTSRNLDEMIERIRQMAIEDENYRLLYSRLTGTDYTTDTVDFTEMMDTHDLQLLTAMWKTFKKQSPDARTIFIFDSGEVNMGESNLSTAARQLKSEYETAIITTVRKKNPYFEYSDKEKKFVGKPSGIKTVKLDSTAAKVEFLKTLGIQFTENEIDKLPTDKKTTFDDAVSGIRESIKNADEIATISGKVLDIEGRLLQLGLVRASISNPEFDSTFFNVKGERTQSFIGTNAISDFFDAISQIDNLNELNGTQYEYLLTDEFVEGSVILSKMFNMKTGERKDSPLFMKAGYADGTVNLANGKRIQSSKLKYKERLVQEINMNLNGYYTNLVPGDASMEHTVFMGNAISEQSLLSGFGNVFKIFGGYLESEIKLSRNPDRIIVQDDKKTRNIKDLRFFKGILGEELHDKIVKDTKTPIEEIYGTNEKPGKYKKQVDQAVEAFIKREAERTKAEMFEYGILKTDPEGELVVDNIAFNKPNELTEPNLNRQLNALAVNYMIANIELHKLIYSDPYQYADELKRIKNFLSPRQAILYGSTKMNEAMNIVYNRGYGKGDIGRTDFNRDYFKTVSYNDVLGEHDLPGYQEAMYKETDGAGIIIYKAYRNFRMRAGKWTAAEETQYRYEIAWEKNDKGLKLSDYEKELLADGNPEVRSAFKAEKPIVAGNKADGNLFNDVVLDKYALYPLSYRVIKQLNPTSNALKLYEKMQKEDIDYVVFDSARKVGAKGSVPLYVDGQLNPAPYESVTNIPFAIMSVQAEVPSKEDEIVTRGSQVTKLATLDFMEAGVPVDFEEGLSFEDRYVKWIAIKTEEKKEAASPIYKEIKNNQMLLEAMMENGYQSLLKRMGIKETREANGKMKYEIESFSEAAKTLREEILKRETNDNIIDSLDDFLNGGAVLEATPAYQQIRNILYSIADKQVISPKITGGMKVQIPSTLLESLRAEAKVVETKKGPKTVYTSDELSFYKDEDGKRVCEIMVGRWFKSDLTDDQLLDLWYEKDKDGKRTSELTEEGRKILSGIGFRIPTQKQNSIDAFVIKRFLPTEFGDNVIVPAALVQKQGSDFDIDKLSIYLKNLFIGKDGKPKLINFLTDKNSTVEERYVHWVRENSNRDTRKYIRFLSRSAVQNLKSNFEIELAKIKAKYQAIRTERKEDLFQEMSDDIMSNINKELPLQDSYLGELFDMGRKVFWRMNDATRDSFWAVRDDIRRRGIKGPEEIRRYLSLTIGLLEDPNTIEEDIVRLEGLEKIYTEELRVMGVMSETLDRIKKDALTAFRNNKKALANTLKLEIAPEFETVGDMYEDAKSKIAFETAQEVASYDGLKSIDDFRRMSIYDQNVKKALENGYVESLEALVTHPKNFGQLIKPNSADQLKDLSKEITKLRGFEGFDYSSTRNMLDRTFMTRLRHAFVSGKYAIGIAAVNQTNHSLNQRQPIYVDRERLESLPKEDQAWLGDGKIKFEQYNSMTINGKEVPVLSMITNKAGEFISDLIGQFIDGYVDIAKGPWIMELGAAQNVASTWLFLIKLGVPIKSVAYFMNQPIIRDYLNSIENAGYSWLFIDSFVNATLQEYNTDVKASDKIPSETALAKMIGQKGNLTKQQLAQQQVILREFLKYAKMANHMFLVTQGSNFDTANFNDPFLVFKKGEQLKKAQNTIISSVDEILKNSFLGKLGTAITRIRDAYAEFLHSDRGNVRTVLENVLRPYVDMSDREFVKLAQKAVVDLFDWAVQTDPSKKLNMAVANILIKDGGAAEELATLFESIKNNKKHPLKNNYVVQNLIHEVTGEVNNMKLKNRDNKVYDQNQVIYGFVELKNYLNGKGQLDVYKRLVAMSILQSGLSSSPISFTQLLPYEDFKNEYNQILSKLGSIPNIEDFYNLGVFQRNNWNNDDIVPYSRARWIQIPDYTFGTRWVYNPAMEFLPKSVKDGIAKGTIPNVVTLSTLSSEAQSEYIVYSWEKGPEELLTEKELKLDPKQQYKLLKEKKMAMKKKGNLSYMQKGLFQKVKESDMPDSDPLVHTYTNSKGVVREYYVYKMVNAWGDSFRANEFYSVGRPSVIDNRFIKTKETSDGPIINAFLQEETKKTKTKQGSTVTRTISTAPIASTTISISSEDERTKTPIEGLNERLDNYGNAKLVLPSNFYEGARPKGRLNAFKSSISTVADNLIVLADLNLNEFDFLSEEDKKRLDALRPLAEELRKINTNDISSADRRTVAVEKRYAALTNQLANEFVDIIGKHVEQQLGKKITSSKPKQAAPTQQPITSVQPKGTINVYWGQAESATSTRILSNLAPRKFSYESIDGVTREYGSVEHAYQSNKSGTFDQANYNAYNNLKEIPGKQGPGYGTKIRGKSVTPGYDNLQLMRDLVVESFKQNSNSVAANKLLQYENFTHNTNELIDKAFLEGLKLAQQRLLSSQQPTTGTEQKPLGKIVLNIIEDWVQSGQATTTVRNSSYHNSFYKGDGVYTTDKGNLVNITHRGLVKLQGDRVVGNGFSYTKDEFAKAEGFGTWANFEKGAKYAGRTLIDGGSVHLYDITPATKLVQPTTADETTLRSQIAALEEKKKTTGITGSEAAQLKQLQTQLGKIIKSRC
jgi:hypothetical protein